MILDSIKNVEHYRGMGRVYTALRYLADHPDMTEFPVELPDGDIVIRQNQYMTAPAEEKMFEAHRRYTDIHYTQCGVEGIACTDLEKLHESSPFSEEKDIGFYQGSSDSICYVEAGMFLVCFPHDAHKPGVMREQPGDVTKLIIKVKDD